MTNSKFTFLSVDFHVNNGKVVSGELSKGKKDFHCNGNDPKAFIDFACNQLKNIGFCAEVKDVVFDGEKYTFTVEENNGSI